MIDLNSLRELHVIKKIEEIIGKWFNIDVVFTDQYGKINEDYLSNKTAYYSYLFKNLTQNKQTLDTIQQDIDQAIYHLKARNEVCIDFHIFLPYVKGVICSIENTDGVFGYIVAFCYTNGIFTKDDAEEVKNALISKGFLEEEAELALRKIARLEIIQGEYLKELLTLYKEEINTYHFEITKREQLINELNSEVSSKYKYHDMIGKSANIQEIYKLLEKISNSESTILIQGENGTGKELVAKAIHYNSPRKEKAFIAQNCSAFNDNLLDSELFGHVKGSFTGAVKDKKGLFEIADGGTLFLDEIGDTSLTMQVKLLRVLQEGTFLPVGATTPRKVNVRVLAATNKPLREMIKKGEFREDLYYRINVININLPSLKDRREDIPLLVEHFLKKKCKEKELPLKSIHTKCLEKLLDHSWPGNIRELENEVERLIVLSGNELVIDQGLLSQRIVDSINSENSTASQSPTNQLTNFEKYTGKLQDAIETVEKILISEGLDRCNFNKSKLAKELDISRASLIMKVEKYSLDKRFKKAS
jgi:transcriptional regulator with PAS, ATPase and Fis domain